MKKRAPILLALAVLAALGLYFLRARAPEPIPEVVEEPVIEEPEPEPPPEPPPEPEEPEPPEPEEPPEPVILPQYAELYEQNPDLAGWLRIDDTVIDYPLMYTPEDQNAYLHRDFDGGESVKGTLFLATPWNEDTNHAIVHGHHMRDGSMFGRLNLYADEDYGKSHATIHFDTLYESRDYQLVSAFYSKVYPRTDTKHFLYYYLPDLSDPEDFAYYVREAKAASLYDTGVEPEWGDSLLTLSTCEYHTENGRFAVVACYHPAAP